MTTAYIAGPMRGYPDNNFPAFHAAEKWLCRNFPQWEFINPASHEEAIPGESLDYYMRYDLKAVVNSDTIVMLEGWMESEYANLEHAVARATASHIYYLYAPGEGEDNWRLSASSPQVEDPQQTARTFESGAVRDTDTGKYDYEGFLSPRVLQEFARYMHRHRQMGDGSLRASDNWQKGFPTDELMKSLLRHVMDLWLLHRTGEAWRPETEEWTDWHDALGGTLFNVMALWHARLSDGQ